MTQYAARRSAPEIVKLVQLSPDLALFESAVRVNTSLLFYRTVLLAIAHDS